MIKKINEIYKRRFTAVFPVCIFLLINFYSCRDKKNPTSAVEIGQSEFNEIDSLNALSFEEINTDPKLAKSLALQSINQSELINYNKGLGEGYSRLGILSKNEGDYPTAIEYHRKSIYYRMFDDDTLAVSRSYNNIGLIYKNIDQFDSAVYYFLNSLKLAEPYRDTVHLCNVTNNLGNVYDNLGEFARSLNYHKQSLSLAILTGKYSNILRSYVNIGSVLVDSAGNSTQPQPAANEALLYLNRVIRDSSSVDYTILRGDAFNNAGLAYQLATNKNADSALYCFMQASELYGEAEAPQLSHSLSNIGLLYFENQNYIRAEEHLLESNRLAEEAGKLNLLATNFKALSEIYNQTGRQKEALAAVNKYIVYHDSVYNENKANIIATLQTKFETEKKDREIVEQKLESAAKDDLISHQKLNLRILIGCAVSLLVIGLLLFNRRQLRKKNEYLKQLESDRLRISHDLHDDIGGALTSISIFSDLANAHIEKNKVNEAKIILEDIAGTSRELMDKMSDLVWAVNPTNDHFINLVNRVKNYCAKICEGKNIIFHYKISETIHDQPLPMELRHHFLLILKEAVTNAVKYSDCKNLYFTVSMNENSTLSEIADDGCGFNTGIAAEGNGLKNMSERAKRMKADLRIDSTISAGTRIQLQFSVD